MHNDDLQQSLEHEAQRIEERIPMGKQKDYTGIAARLCELKEEHGLSQGQIARALGVNTSVISQFLRNKYEHDNRELVNKIVNYINSMARKERQKQHRPKSVETSVAIAIKTLIANTEAYSEEEGRIGLIIGDAGHGKSHCLRAYAQANKNTIYVELDDAMTIRDVFKAIAGAIGLEEYGTQGSITQRIIDNLRNRQTIIMLDECSGLGVKQLNRLRQIIVVKSRRPLILAGNKDLLCTVMRKSENRGCESLDQFTSRLMAVVNLDEIATGTDTDRKLYTTEDIRKLYEYGGVRLDNGAVKALRKICLTRRTGRLRTCSLIITALHASQKISKARQITVQDIIGTINKLDLPVRVHIPLNTDRAFEDEKDESLTAVG